MTCMHCNDTGSKGGLYLDCAHCDAANIMAQTGAAARLADAAPKMRALLAEYLSPALPDGFSSQLEWKADFDCRVRCVLLRIAGTDAFAQPEAA